MIRAANHLATSLEDHALFNPQAGGMNVSTKDGRSLNLHSVLCSDLSRNFATDNHSSGLNRGLDPGPLANHQGVGREDLAPKRAANAHGPEKAQLSLELAAGLNDARDGRRLNSYWEGVVAGHV